MSRFGVFALLAMMFVAQALAADEPAKEEETDLYNRPSHFNMEMYRLATIGAFIVVAAVTGLVVYKTCSWPRLE